MRVSIALTSQILFVLMFLIGTSVHSSTSGAAYSCRSVFQERWPVLSSRITTLYSEETIEVDNISSWSYRNYAEHVGRPIAYQSRNAQGANTTQQRVGPIFLHWKNSFTMAEQSLIEIIRVNTTDPFVLSRAMDKWHSEQTLQITNELIELRRRQAQGFKSVRQSRIQMLERLMVNRQQRERIVQGHVENGVEIGKWIVTLKSGRTFETDMMTSFDPHTMGTMEGLNALIGQEGIQPADIVKLQLFHSHPGNSLAAVLISPGDVEAVQFYKSFFASRGLKPEIHVYAVSLEARFGLVSHYSDREL